MAINYRGRALATPRETAQSGSRAFVLENSSPTRGSKRETDQTPARIEERVGEGGREGGREARCCGVAKEFTARISLEYGISVPHVRVPGTIAPVPYREHIRGRVQLSPRAGGSIKHRRLRGFIPSKLARAPHHHTFPR